MALRNPATFIDVHTSDIESPSISHFERNLLYDRINDLEKRHYKLMWSHLTVGVAVAVILLIEGASFFL
ncbi:MAG: hypothetical protein VCD00_05260 [Candidatus Hydrogenedentota bacterium]